MAVACRGDGVQDLDAIATRTLLEILVSQGRQREALEMARGLLRDSPGDGALERTVMNLEQSIRAGDPFHGLSADGRARIRLRLEGFVSRIRARRRNFDGLAPEYRPGPAVEADAGIAPALAESCGPAAEDTAPLVLDQVASGVVSTYESCIEPEPVAPAAAAEAGPVPLTAHERRGLKLRLLESLMDRVARHRKGASA